MDRLRRVPVRALLLLGFVVLAVRAASLRPAPVAVLRPDIVAALLFLYLPAFHYGVRRAPAWLHVRSPRRSATTFLLLAAAGCAAYLAYTALPFGPATPASPAELPPPGAYLLRQALFVALPEEVFFRGYLYDSFEEKGIGPVLPTSALFALAHLAIHASPWRAMTFFPALLFGWGRRRSGNVYVPALLHLAFNFLPYGIEARR